MILTSDFFLRESLYDLETGKAQQELLLAGILKADGGLGILTGAFHFQHGAHSEALVGNGLPGAHSGHGC